MAHYSIISSQSGAATLWTGAPKYVGAYLKPGYLEFPAIGSPTAIAWHVGDYVVYSRTGKTYRLYRTPQAAEQGVASKYGASFLYENVQFFDDSKQLEFCPFTDLVPGDNTVHFSTQNTVSFFGKPANVAERIQACLEAQYGAGSWEIRIVTTSDPDLLEILNTEIEFSVTGANCQDVLDKVYDEWGGLGWIHTVENGKNIITIGASNVRTAANTTVPFAFDNGLVRVQRSIANADQIGTRLFAYGSMKNMDATYYRGLDIYHAESVDIEHLMIPLASWGITDGKPDARKAFIQDAAAIAALGLIPRTAYFDGSGDLPDIHPTIERMTIGEVYDAGGAGYVPDLSKWNRADRIDEIVAATNPTDHGTSAEQGQKYSEIISSHLDTVSASNQEGQIDEKIWEGTTTKAGRLTLKLGGNNQTFTMMSGWTNPEFSGLQIEVLINGTERASIPLDVVSSGAPTWTVKLPETITIKDAPAGTIAIYVFGYVLRNQQDTYANARTYTFSTDATTPVSVKVEYEIAKTFVVRIPQIGFDIDDYADLGNGKTVSMKTGMCAGRDFQVKDAAYVPSADAWDLTLYRSIDEDLNIMFPNADYEIAAGDQYVLLDIAMPEMYVTVASSRLLAAAQKLLADICVEKPFYAPQIDAKVVYNESRLLREGMWMDITQEGNREYVLIDSITIDENGSNIPTYEVALREKKGIDWTENIGKSSSSRSSQSVAGRDTSDAAGSVTSVGLEVPVGMVVEGSPITSKGTIRVSLADGYVIPKEEDVGYFEPDTSYSGGIKLRAAYGGVRVPGIRFGAGASDLDLKVVNIAGEGEEPIWALRSRLPFFSESWVSAHGISNGGGIAPGNTSMVVRTNTAEFSNGTDTFETYSKSYLDAAIANAGSVKQVAGVSPDSYGNIPTSSLKTALGIANMDSDLTTISTALQSLQSQIDSIATRNMFDELTATALYADVVAASAIYASTIVGDLTGNASTASKLTTAGPLNIWGVQFWNNGIPNAVTGRPNLYIGTTQVQTSSAAQALTGITSLTASGLATVGSFKLTSGPTLTWDATNEAWHLSGNFYADGWVSSGGISSSGGSSGVDLAAVWASLTNTAPDAYANTQIAEAHIPDMANTYSYVKASDISDMATKTWVNNQGFLTSSSISDMATKTWVNQQGFVTSSGVTSIATGTGLTGGPITSTGTISISSTYQTYISNGNTAYGWGNHATAGYATSAALSADEAIIDSALQSLQAQIDSVASRDMFDELKATSLFAGIGAFSCAYADRYYLTDDIYFVVDSYTNGGVTTKYVRLVGNFAADGFVSSGGVSPGSGSSGIDLDAMWQSLTTTTDAHASDVIAVGHIPNITTAKISDLESWITAKGYVTSSGVTSVAMTVPTGFSLAGSPITTTGTLALTFASGYSLPTDAKQSNWDTAYNNSHTHSNKSVLDGITSTKVSNWDTAYGWGNHANAGYASASDLSALAGRVTTIEGNESTISTILQSLQAQIDSVASRDNYDDLTATAFFADIAAIQDLRAAAIELAGNDLATTLTGLANRATTLEGYFTSGSAKSAVKLLNSRTIWGQSFDGTANVSGALSGATTIAASTSVTAPKFYLSSGVYFELDSSGYVHLVVPSGKGLYCDGFVSSGGISGGGGSSGVDLDAVWASLTNTASDSHANDLIATAHIPDMANTYSYVKTSAISDMATKTWVTSQGYATGAQMTIVSDALQSLQAQVDSVASRDMFDELKATALYADVLAASAAHLDALEVGGESMKSIPNSFLANSAITLNGTSVALGGSFNTANITAGTAGTSSATSGVSFSIPYVTMNKYGVVTGYGTHTHTISQANIFGSSAIGSSSLPVYYNGSALTACTKGDLFSALSSSAATNLSVTVAGQTRTATLYATYDSASENISDKFGIVGSALQSLQSQIDSAASRNAWDEVVAAALFSDQISAVSGHFTTLEGELSGNATTASYLVSTSYGVGSSVNPVYFSGGRPLGCSYSFGNASGNAAINNGTLNTNLYAYKAQVDADGGNIASNMTTIGAALMSLQAQINSVASFFSSGEIVANFGAFDSVSATGNIVALGYITSGYASDKRLKENIKTMSSATARRLVMALRPVTFRWNDVAEGLFSDLTGDDLGFIAQEVEPLVPSAIGSIFGEYKRLEATKLIAPLVGVAQDHERRIADLERENKELKRRLNIN